MKISLNWLRRYVDAPSDPGDLESLLSSAGLAVEGVRKTGADHPGVVVAQILDSQPHPNADRLSVCHVHDGSGTPRQIVCGAKNYRVGDKVPLALPGAELPGGVRIKTGRLRGVESQGMLCSARELELAEDAEGLLILPAHAVAGAPISSLFPPDVIFDLEVTPNRPDCLGHIGVAREVAAFTGACLRLPETPALDFLEGAEAAVRDAGSCPLYTLVKIEGLAIGPSPDWLAQDLQAVGLRPINVAVDITNWVMMETGQPLHVFDAAKVRGRVEVRGAQPGESLEGLDGRSYSFEGGELLIADESGPLALAGIVGGKASGVEMPTRDVLLESAAFHPALIRRIARRHGAATESSHRFERGVDPAGTLAAARRAAALLAELAGGKVAPAGCRCGAMPTLPPVVPFRPARCRALLGADIADSEMRSALLSLGLREQDGGWQPPSHRRDLTREADLVEEVARRLGMDRIPGRVACQPACASAADRLHDLAAGWKDRLAALGLSEARSPALVASRAAAAFPGAIALRNPLGADQSFLRPSLLPGLLDALRRNLHAGAASVALFEIGKIFRADSPEERQVLGVLLHGSASPLSWRRKEPRVFDFHDMKGLVEALIPGCGFRMEEPDALMALRMEVVAGSTGIGHIGQAPPAIARELDARGPVLLCELAIEERLAAAIPAFSPIPSFPSSRRDLAVVAPASLPYEAISSEIRGMNEPLLVSLTPFDVFADPAGEHLPADAKSLALALTFAAPNRTLTSEEVSLATSRIKERLRERLGVSFRE